MKNRIAFFDFNINFGGAPKGSISLAKNLEKAGSDIYIYDAYGKNNDYVKFIKGKKLNFRVIIGNADSTYIGGKNIFQRLFRFFIQIPSFVVLVFKLRKIAMADQIDLIWVNNTKSLFFSSISVLGLGIPRVLYHRGWARRSDTGKLDRFLIRFFSKALIAHSKATESNLKEMFPNKPVTYVPNSVQLDEEAYDNNSKHQNSGIYNLILPAARPVYEKGHHTALQALSILSERGFKNIRLFFPGILPVGASDKYLTELISYIRQNGLDEKVTFLGWVDDLPNTLKAYDIMLLPSHTEGFPRVVIESMLKEVLVIATPVGGIPEVVHDGETGFLVEINNPEALADAIERVISQPALASTIVQNAKQIAEIQFSVENQTSGVLQAFEEVLRDE